MSTGNVSPIRPGVQTFSLDLAFRGVHARLRGYKMLLALWLLTRTDVAHGFELTIEEMAEGVGVSPATIRRALAELHEENAFVRDRRVRWRYSWNVETLNAWAAGLKGSSFTPALATPASFDAPGRPTTGLVGMICEAHRDARVQRYRVDVAIEPWPYNLPGAEDMLSWVREQIDAASPEHEARDVVRAIVEAFVALEKPLLVERRHGLKLLANGHDRSTLSVDVPKRLTRLARERRREEAPPVAPTRRAPTPPPSDEHPIPAGRAAQKVIASLMLSGGAR